MQCNSIQINAMHHTNQCNAMQHNIIQGKAMQCNVLQQHNTCYATQHNTMQCNAMQYCDAPLSLGEQLG